MKYCIAVLLLLSLLGCAKFSLLKEESKPAYESKIELGWINDSICKLEIPNDVYRPLGDNDLTCCIIDCASQGVLECEEFIVNRIKEHYNPDKKYEYCLLYTSPSPRDATLSRMPSSA